MIHTLSVFVFLIFKLFYSFPYVNSRDEIPAQAEMSPCKQPLNLPYNMLLVTVPSGQSPHHIQCTQSKVYNNVKISGGSQAGDFTDVGKVGRMHICTRLCCEEPVCDLAYMVRQSCYLVKCADEKKCRVIGAGIKEKAHNKTTDTSVQYIIKRNYNVQFGKGKLIGDSTKAL